MASHSRMGDRSNPADLRKGVVGDVRLLDDGTLPSDPWRIVGSHSSSAALEALCDGVGCSSLFEDAGERALSERRCRTGRMQDDARGDALNAADPALGSDPPLVRRLKEVVLTGPRFDAAEADVARELGLSGRTLRRRLRELGTTYAWTLAEIRFAFAKRCLADPGLTIGEVADRAGYTEVSNFRCAFKRWANCSPQTFRNSLGVPFDN